MRRPEVYTWSHRAAQMPLPFMCLRHGCQFSSHGPLEMIAHSVICTPAEVHHAWRTLPPLLGYAPAPVEIPREMLYRALPPAPTAPATLAVLATVAALALPAAVPPAARVQHKAHAARRAVGTPHCSCRSATEAAAGRHSRRCLYRRALRGARLACPNPRCWFACAQLPALLYHLDRSACGRVSRTGCGWAGCCARFSDLEALAQHIYMHRTAQPAS